MFKSLLALVALVTFSTALQAQSPLQLAKTEQQLSRKLLAAYLNGSRTDPIFQDLRQVQQELKGSLRDPEIRNLLTFLDLCIEELRPSLRRPVTPANIEIVSDLTTSIAEGSRFILGSVGNEKLLARR
jgi:hypothetical protein